MKVNFVDVLAAVGTFGAIVVAGIAWKKSREGRELTFAQEQATAQSTPGGNLYFTPAQQREWAVPDQEDADLGFYMARSL